MVLRDKKKKRGGGARTEEPKLSQRGENKMQKNTQPPNRGHM